MENDRLERFQSSKTPEPTDIKVGMGDYVGACQNLKRSPQCGHPGVCWNNTVKWFYNSWLLYSYRDKNAKKVSDFPHSPASPPKKNPKRAWIAASFQAKHAKC